MGLLETVGTVIIFVCCFMYINCAEQQVCTIDRGSWIFHSRLCFVGDNSDLHPGNYGHPSSHPPRWHWPAEDLFLFLSFFKKDGKMSCTTAILWPCWGPDGNAIVSPLLLFSFIFYTILEPKREKVCFNNLALIITLQKLGVILIM